MQLVLASTCQVRRTNVGHTDRDSMRIGGALQQTVSSNNQPIWRSLSIVVPNLVLGLRLADPRPARTSTNTLRSI